MIKGWLPPKSGTWTKAINSWLAALAYLGDRFKYGSILIWASSTMRRSKLCEVCTLKSVKIIIGIKQILGKSRGLSFFDLFENSIIWIVRFGGKKIFFDLRSVIIISVS